MHGNGSYIKPAKSINWGTPQCILQRKEENDITYGEYFDPCPYPNPDWNGLDIPWPDKVFINPPFKALKEWVKKCAEEHVIKEQTLCDHHFVLLMPARVDTSYFHEYVAPYADVEFIKGRLKFIDLDASSTSPVNSPFPTILCHFKNNTINGYRGGSTK